MIELPCERAKVTDGFGPKRDMGMGRKVCSNRAETDVGGRESPREARLGFGDFAGAKKAARK